MARKPSIFSSLTSRSRKRSMPYTLVAVALLLALLMPAVTAWVPTFLQASAQSRAAHAISVSAAADRGRPAKLQGKAVAGDMYVFVEVEIAVRQVRFFLDQPDELVFDPDAKGKPEFVDAEAPYDFAGTVETSRGKAKPFDTKKLSNGVHTIVAAVDRADGGTELLHSRFIVHNGQPAVLFDPGPLRLKVHKGGKVSKSINVFTSNSKNAELTVTSSEPWLTIDKQGGDRLESHSIAVDSSKLAPGTYSATLSASATGFVTTTQTVELQVTQAAACSPLPCSQIKVALPYELGFNQDHTKILDANTVGTGFTYVDQPTNATGYIPQNLVVNTATPGVLNLTTTSGIQFTTANSQDNAIAVGIDAPSQISLIKTTLRNPPAGGAKNEQAGLWFGNDQDNYVKLVVISSSTGTKIQYLMETSGSSAGALNSASLNLASSAVGLQLRANPSDRSITASYTINGGTPVTIGQFTAPSEFFSFDAAGIDPTIGTRSFGGIFATHRAATSPLTYAFDNFSVTAEPTAPPPTSDVSFQRSSFPIPFPTSMVWGPDNRLYVTELYGKIHAITLNDAKQVVADQVITTLGSRLTLGITVDPASTAENVVLWVAHSNESTNNGELNSGTVTRLSGTNFANREDVIVGLPRAIANHSINSLHFGPDGKLYIAMGGNTGAGAPNTANSEFGTRAEQPLSAALLVADVKAANFDGTCATSEQTFAPAPCSVVPFATGIRNMYDFVHHSNGSIYGPDNGLGVTGTYPPKTTPDCTGFGSATAWTQGGHNPGEQPDLLLRIEAEKYYGHPNPYRNECVYKDGSYQNVTPLANYTQPLYNLGLHKSADGIIEYSSDVFGGPLKGELLITNYSVGDDITRVKLSADGRSVVSIKQLASGFNNPLPLAQGPDGTIYVGESGGNKVTALKPIVIGSDTTPPTILDVAPAAGATNSAANSNAMATFSEAINANTLTATNFTLVKQGSATPVNASITFDPGTKKAILNPTSDLEAGITYTATVKGGSTGVKDLAGNALASDRVWSFTTAGASTFSTINWSTVAPYPLQMAEGQGVVVDGKLYVFGGYPVPCCTPTPKANVYDPTTNTWTALADMPIGLTHTGVVVDGRDIYMVGGWEAIAGGGRTTGSKKVWKYNIDTNTYTRMPDLPVERGAGIAAIIGRNLHYVSGLTLGLVDVGDHYVLSLDGGTTWTTKAPLPNPRNHLGSVVFNGKMYAIGGQHGEHTTLVTQSSVHVYDPATDVWTALASLPRARGHIAASTFVMNGRIIVAGGETAHGVGIPDVTAYDPVANTWSELSPLPSERRSAVAGVINGTIYSTTGSYTTATYKGSPVVLDGSENLGTWATKQSLPNAILDGGGAALENKLYFVAGKTSAGPLRTMYVYNPTTNAWAAGPSLPTAYPAVENPSVVAYNGKLYVMGGSSAAFSGATSTTAVFDPATGQWTMLASMTTPRGGATAQTIGTKIYVTGGMDNTGASLASTEVYDVATNTWSVAAPMLTRRDNPGSASIGGKLYVFGGRTRNANGSVVSDTLASSEMYDPATNTWITRAPMPTPRRALVVGTIGGRAQVITGERTSTGGTYNQNEEYDAATNSWRTLTQIPTPRHGAISGTINDVVYVVGGGPTGGSSYSSVNEAFTIATTTPGDTTPPTVTSVTPLEGAAGVSAAINVGAVFSEAIDATTLSASSFTLVNQGSATAVAAALSYDSVNKVATLNPNTDLEPGVTYVATVKGGPAGVKDAAGNVLVADKVWTFKVLSGTPPPTGLSAEYFDNSDFTSLKVTRIDQTVNFNWDTGSPDPTVGPDTFSVRWTGKVKADVSETYTFFTTSNDGVRLWVNNQLVVNNWTVHSTTENSGNITLQAGQWYDIKLEYFEGKGKAVIALAYSSPSTPKQVIPADRLTPLVP